MGTLEEKELAARASAELVRDGMMVGLGTGSTVAYLLQALAKRKLRVTYVASSPRTERDALALGLNVKSFESIDQLDLAIDGADQISESGWLIKGGGGALTREKIVAASSSRFVIIADATKLVTTLHAPVPLELNMFGLHATLRRLEPTSLRNVALSPDGGVIADYLGAFSDPVTLAQHLSSTPGVIEHGLFGPDLVSEVFVGVGKEVRHSKGE